MFNPRKLGALVGAIILSIIGMFVAPAAFANDARIAIYSKTHNFASLVDAAGETTTVTAPGVVLGDACVGVSLGVDLQGITTTCYISAADTVTVRAQNESGGTLDLASSTLRVFVMRKGTR